MTDDLAPEGASPDNVVPQEEMARRRRVLQLAEDVADLFNDIGERVLELRTLGVPTTDWVPIMTEQFSDRFHVAAGEGLTRSGLPALFDVAVRYLSTPEGEGEGYQMTKDDYVAAGKIGMAAADTRFIGGGIMGVFEVLAPLLMSFFGGKDKATSPPGVDGSKVYVPATMLAGVQTQVQEYVPPDVSRFLSPDAVRTKRLLDRLFAEAPKLPGREDQAPALECSVMLKAGGSMQGSLSTTPEGGLRLLAVNEIKKPGQPPTPIAVEHFFDYEQVADVAVFREMTTSANPESRIITS